MTEIDWRDEAFGRARSLMPNQALFSLTSLMARTHPFAIQYLEQAPAIAVFYSWGKLDLSPTERHALADRFGDKVRRGLRLKEIMENAGAPLPLRKLRGPVIIPSNFEAILELRKIPPSVLAQSIPTERPLLQLEWLRALRDWQALTRARWDLGTSQGEAWEWGVKAFGRAAVNGRRELRHHVSTLMDFFARNPDRLHSKLTFDGALAAADRWHIELGRRRTEAAQLEALGIGFDQLIDYGSLPETIEAGSYTFHALRSAEALFSEGAAMRHCVATYIKDVVFGVSRIYSIRKDRIRVATVEFHESDLFGLRMVQLRGPSNASPSREIQAAASAFLAAQRAHLVPLTLYSQGEVHPLISRDFHAPGEDVGGKLT
ncbi:hypothetical protein K32_24350 [Kaistia sp. 32K]|uniref:PcfJ domain-containing protein n=1 Tax=Kaistia sp. 32K TaxID=2795690 RepID=UPI001914DCA6|nr:PcfJ domain-containing protein [Kaistia sp. 32K]BCP53818.1 hypothetical protein K32_24350 [Kaistia sp. 32K]